MARIEVLGLSKAYQGEPALIDLDLAIQDGEFVTLLGPSGSGKTTTLNLLAGFLQPDAGVITIDGRTVSEPGKVVDPGKRGMGMVFQSYALWPHKTVYSNVAYGLQRLGLASREVRERVGTMLELVGLDDLGDRFPGQLSGGQQQRVALARSLVTEPAMLLLDEPLSNLDAKLRAQMRSEVQQIQRRLNTTFVYVTHDQVEALSMSDRVAVMNRGRLEQVGTPLEVYMNPATAFVADFMGLINFVPGEVVACAEGMNPRVTVRLSLGGHLIETPSTATGKLVAGDHVIVGLRPEVVRITSPNAPIGDVPLLGEVVHVTLLGNIIHYTIAAHDQKLKVQTSYDTMVDVGSQVGIEFDELHARVYLASDPYFKRLWSNVTDDERNFNREGRSERSGANRANA